jgi:hypothetical protein
MKLSPSRYMCKQHNLDMTEKVKEGLKNEVVVGYGLRSWRSRSRHQSRRHFRVVVECPGNGRPHQLAFEGEVLEQ